MESKPDIIGYVGTGISVIGAIGAMVFNQPALAGIPVAIGVGCNMLSRNQLAGMLVESHQQNEEAIANLTDLLTKNQSDLNSTMKLNQANISEQLKQLQENVNNSLTETKVEMTQKLQGLESKQEKVADIVTNLRDIETYSQDLRVQPDSAEYFYQRGFSYQQLGNKSGAIEDYTESINKNSSFAPAYHKRGVVYLELGDRKKAVDDLRKAALLYFEQGDIESYQKAREMSRNIHELKTSLNSGSPEAIVGIELFKN